MIDNISVVILSKNNELTINNTLSCLKKFKDVVVYDNGSTDNTIKIIEKFDNINLIKGEFKGFGWTKNKAASYAKNDWILIIDSDEVIDEVLFNTLLTIKLDITKVYQLNFKAYYKQKQIKHCGWSNQKIKRLYNKSVTSYNGNAVHEDIIIDNFTLEILDGYVHHYSYHSISQFIIKADYYSTLFAKNNVGKKSSSPIKAYFNAIYSFVKTYIFKLGFLDGYAGLIIAFSHMSTNFYKYIKLYELNLETKSKKI